MPVDVCWGAGVDPPANYDELARLLSAHGAALLQASDRAGWALSLMLTTDEHIAQLNRTWRGEDKPTDVLSFPMSDDDDDGMADVDEAEPLGDVVISLPTAARQAAKHSLGLSEEVTFLLVHGFCHLLGHDHAEAQEAAAMRSSEDRLLAIVAPGQRRPPTPY